LEVKNKAFEVIGSILSQKFEKIGGKGVWVKMLDELHYRSVGRN
jgi:hypothetical protein